MVITTRDALKIAIDELEIKKELQKEELVAELQRLHESLKPLNIVKNTLHEITSGRGTGSRIVSALFGIGAGVLSNKIMLSSSANILARIAGSVVEIGQTVIKKNNGGQTQSRIGGMFRRLLSSTRKPLA